MTSFVALIGLSIAVYVPTNVDALFILLALFIERESHRSQVVLGFAIGSALLFAACIVLARVAVTCSSAYVAWLGLVPIALGCLKIRQQHREGNTGAGTSVHEPPLERAGGVLSVALLTIVNGADNIAAYAPQFAVHRFEEISVMGLVFAGMSLLWCVIARALLGHPMLEGKIHAYGRRWVPYLLIGVGLLTLVQGGIFKP